MLQHFNKFSAISNILFIFCYYFTGRCTIHSSFKKIVGSGNYSQNSHNNEINEINESTECKKAQINCAFSFKSAQVSLANKFYFRGNFGQFTPAKKFKCAIYVISYSFHKIYENLSQFHECVKEN